MDQKKLRIQSALESDRQRGPRRHAGRQEVQDPNSDTPYSALGLDLRAEPIVLDVPKSSAISAFTTLMPTHCAGTFQREARAASALNHPCHVWSLAYLHTIVETALGENHAGHTLSS
jgi:Protein of unknown function (DUF1254)